MPAGAGAGLQPSLFPPLPRAHEGPRCQRAAGYAACASASTSAVGSASTAGPERICRTSGASRVSPEATTISTAAPYWVADTPTAAAIGPITSAPSGIAPTDPRMSYADTRASRFGGTFRVTVTVHCTIMTSMAMPRPTAATQITGSGHSAASASGEIAMVAPMSTTNRIGRLAVYRSPIRPPMISPTASAAVIRPQAAAPPRCARATTGPSTWNAPYQAASTMLY